MKFRDHNELPYFYRTRYLDQIDYLAPEVMADLKALALKYKAFFEQQPYPRQLSMAEWLCTSSETGFATHDLEGNFRPVQALLEIAQNSRFLSITEDAITKSDNRLLAEFLDLRVGFQNFIDCYFLNSDWLRHGLLSLLGDISQTPEHFNHLWQGMSFGFFGATGESLTFKLDGWEISDDSEQYRKSAMRTFETHLRTYIERTV